MVNLKPDRLISFRSFLTTGILALTYYSLSQLPDNFYETIGSQIKYKWLMILAFLLLLIALYFLLSYLIINSKLSKLKSAPEKIDSTMLPAQPIQKEVTTPPKAEPEKPIQYEKFHTFDGVTFKYHVHRGILYDGYFCSKDRVQLRPTYANGNSWNVVAYKCPMCKERLEMNQNELNDIRDSFKAIVISFVSGHLNKLPSRSES